MRSRSVKEIDAHLEPPLSRILGIDGLGLAGLGGEAGLEVHDEITVDPRILKKETAFGERPDS